MDDFKRFSLPLILFVALPMVTVAQATGPNPNSPPPLGKLVDVGGYRVHLYCTGFGSPTVVILGAGFSFDWGLVQPQVASITQVCSYDHSGSAWSDDGPTDSCSLRVSEIHEVLKNAGIKGPYVLVGHSLGALVARLYAGQYPNDVAGLVFVDHAMAMINRRSPSGGATMDPPPMSPAPPPPGGVKMAAGMEDDPNFGKLSARDREFHLWASKQVRGKADSPGKLPGGLDMVLDCVAQADAIGKDQSHPLGDKPLVDISAGNAPPIPAAEQWRTKYTELHSKLLSMSVNSKELVAENSGHFIIIDRPDVVIDAIGLVVQSVRNNNKL
jgi:pimeloyl-ACP methyl ester carboxylesterase